MREDEVEPEMQLADAEILRLLLDRDPQGLRMLIEAHAPRTKWLLTREFRKELGDDGVEDALAEGLHRVWRAIAGYRPDRGPLRAWFFVICRNCARKQALRQGRAPRPSGVLDWNEVPAPTGSGPTASDPTGEEVSEGAASPWLGALRSCMAALPRLMRAVIDADLRHPDGLAPADDLVNATGSSVGSVYNARSKARSRLRACMEHKGFDFARAAAPETSGQELAR